MRRHFIIRAMVIILLVFALALPSATFAADQPIITTLNKRPPSRCVSKAPYDTSSGMKTRTEGITREDVMRVMVCMASKSVDSNRDLLSAQSARNIDTVYTAVFYQDNSINEVGIYAYRFFQPIRLDDFKATEFNGKLFVINNELLVLLWHEDLSRTAGCFSAIGKALETYSEKPKQKSLL